MFGVNVRELKDTEFLDNMKKADDAAKSYANTLGEFAESLRSLNSVMQELVVAVQKRKNGQKVQVVR